ncbi:MAG: WD40 repeat domain-containing protein [Saprospiraceae bacterium]
MPTVQVQKIAQLTGHNAAIFALAQGADPQHFLSAAGDGWVVSWDLAQPELGKLIAKVDTQVFSLLPLVAHNKLVVGNMNGGVHWVDLANPDATKNILHHQKGVFAIILVNEDVITLGGEGKITRWSVGERRSLESLHLSNQSLRSADFSQIRNEIAVGASDNHIYLLDASKLEVNKIITNAHNNSVFSVKYSPDGRYLLSGGRDAHLNIWDTHQDFHLVSSQPAHWFTINDIVFSPDTQYFATASRDKTIKIWDANTFELLKVLDTIRDGGHINSVNRLLWAAYNNYLMSCSDDRSIIIWKVEA